MNKLNIELENCFGIGKLKQEFDFTNTNAYLIYASNGTMKSSFAKTFELISEKKEKEICDRVYKDRKTFYNIKEDEKDIQPETIFVVNAENNCDSTAKISSFIANKELKIQYDSIYINLNKEKKELLRQLKKIAISTDCEEEFVTAFRENDKDDFFTCIQKIVNLLKKDPENFKFRYNDIFDKTGKVKNFLERKKVLLQNYFQEYKKLLSQSSFFNELSDKSFGTHQAEQIKKAVEDNTFFYAGHKFLLKNSANINSSKDLISLIQNEIDNIFEDEKLKDIFNKIDKELNANKELRLFKEVIEKDKSIIPRLNDYYKFEKDVLISYFSKLKEDTENLNSLYQSKKKGLQKIIEEAKKQTDIWKDIVDTFNKRFYVPFVVNIENQDDIILKEKAIPHINFKYKDVDDKEPPIPREKEELLKILSKGEQRAYYILQMIFEIETRKAQNKETLIIFDDIADSFDYKNKYAIIEYIKDLKYNENKLFKLIILTHNFDFYRTIGSRLDLMKFCLMATKDSSRIIKLFSGKYFKDVFNNVFIERSQKQNKIENKIFISLIPFVRNLIEYCNGSEDPDYLKLTSCLHLKENTIKILSKDILDIIVRKLNRLKDVKIDFENEKIFDLIFDTAEEIITDSKINEIDLENKIVLSIAIRLSAEKFMIDKLQFKTDNIDKNQTSFLFDKYKEKFQGKEFKSQKDSLAEVLMMTTENIHINAFMYEPLIDMSVLHLIDLYKKIKKLNNSNTTET